MMVKWEIIRKFILIFGLTLIGSRAQAEEWPPRIVHHPSDVVVRVGSPATLSCRADGAPKPSIGWLRNGQPLETAQGDGQLTPMVLSEGSLFFLSVGGGRRGQSHEGVYACVARNGVGVATSRNASLFIAGLQDEFSVQPADVEVAEGQAAVLNCGPPAGHPEPNVSWKKDGVPINSSDHHYTVVDSLFIARFVLLAAAAAVFLLALFMLLPFHFLEPVHAKALRAP
ncbi:unnamed protein product [Menidia menidia]|uniref:(Atlantic silverside) hypothetical protein n=1 Tax=Menidia menidia TaxID=238744 RepID=A0A8S4APP1_9TELE|nr:unnamed protein product [Menidia menidia]